MDLNTIVLVLACIVLFAVVAVLARYLLAGKFNRGITGGRDVKEPDAWDRYYGYGELLHEKRGGGSGVEYEAKFLDVDVNALRAKLREIGAESVHEDRDIRRAVYKLADSDAKGFARVRDEGDSVTMTSKIYDDKSPYPVETEITIKDDFAAGKKFLDSLMIQQKAYQETRREKWRLPDSQCNEIAIDTIPGIPTYVEIDCKSEDEVKRVAALLGFDFKDAHFGSFARTYDELYGMDQKIINDKTPIIDFATAEEKLGPLVTKNREKFIETVRAQAEKFGKK